MNPFTVALVGTLLMLTVWSTLPLRAWWLRRQHRRVVIARLMTVCARGAR